MPGKGLRLGKWRQGERFLVVVAVFVCPVYPAGGFEESGCLS